MYVKTTTVRIIINKIINLIYIAPFKELQSIYIKTRTASHTERDSDSVTLHTNKLPAINIEVVFSLTI